MVSDYYVAHSRLKRAHLDGCRRPEEERESVGGVTFELDVEIDHKQEPADGGLVPCMAAGHVP